MESVLITTPYSVDDCSGPNAQQLGRVQKIVRLHVRTCFHHDLISHRVLILSHFQCIPYGKQLEAERKRLKMA